jgi:SHS2 domain-containing protein
MRYKFLEDVATADVAFEAEGKTLEELLEACALATTNVMVRNMDAIMGMVTVDIKVTADSEEALLFKFLEEVIFYKDAKQLIFGKYEIRVASVRNREFELRARATGEKLDPKKHDLIVDVKAVTYHQFEVRKAKGSWTAHVILDI